MDYDTVVGEIQNRAQFDSREDALRAARITLETVSRRIDPGAADDVAAQLPEEIGRHLSKVDEVERFDWDEFVDRIEEEGGYGPDDEGDAVHHARVVMDVVDEAVTGDVLRDVRATLPDDDGWEELFALVDQEEAPVDEEQRPQ